MQKTVTSPSVRALLLCALVPVAIGCGKPGTGDPRSTAPQFLNHAPDVRYVGRAACRECHLDHYGTYAKTGMGRAFYPMSAEVAVEDFTRDNELAIPESGLRYRMVERGGKYYQRQYVLDAEGDEVAVDEHELIWAIGSNNHSRSYVIERAGKLFQAPVCWYPQEQMWELCPGFEVKNDHFGREISQSCIQCHNGKMRLVEGQRNEFERPFPHGIGCERCHGPGQLHVEKWKAHVETPTGAGDPTIVHPRRLSPAARIGVCFQCHLGDARATERVARHDRDIDDFRPGMLITDFVVPFRYSDATELEFGISAQSDRLVNSRCYTESEGRLECLTCHNPHVTVYAEDRPSDYFRVRCLSCHAEEDCGEAHGTRQATDGVPDDCVACHMRKAEPDDQRFTEITDHWIRREIRSEGVDHRETYEVEPVFPESYARIPRGERAYYRARALYLLARDAPERRRPWMWTRAEEDFREAIEGGYDNVWSWYFLGKTQRNMGKHREADEAFRRAHEHEPAHHDAAFAWGQVLLGRRQTEEALAVFEKLVERDPGDEMALAEAGRALQGLGRPDEALRYFERALREEPWSSLLHVNTGKILAMMGRFEEAADLSAAAVRLDPDDPDVWEFYEKAHLAAGRETEAAEAARLRSRLTAAKGG